MPVYAYRGLNADGRAVDGIIDADNPKGARLKLRGSGIFPTDVIEQAEGNVTAVAASAGGLTKWLASLDPRGAFDRVNPQDLALMTRQLATLVGAGLPLVECLEALAEQVDSPRQKRILSQVREHVVEGGTLADGFLKHPRVFSELYVNMVRAGEASGALDIVLLRLADYTERSAALRGKVRAALTYPAVMFFFAGAILFFLLSYVVPRITRIFTDMNQQLPTMTVILLRLSDAAQQYWWAVASLLLLLVVGLRAWYRTESGRLRLDRFQLNIPYVGKLLRKVALARFARTLSTLLDGGIPLLTALDIVKNVVSNMVLRQAVEAARDSIREGHSIAMPLKKSGLFPPLLVHMIAVGEKSGELESMLARAADTYDNEVEASVSALSSIMEPFIIVFMGGIVLFIVLSILLPIFELNELVK